MYRTGVYRLRMGGWNTMTTRSRLNAYSPADVSTDRGVPYVFWDSGRVLRLWDTFDPAEDNYLPLARYRVPFREGMTVTSEGIPNDPRDLAGVEREEEYMTRAGKRRCRWAKGWGDNSLPIVPAKETAAP